jgi:hypothetical protein
MLHSYNPRKTIRPGFNAIMSQYNKGQLYRVGADGISPGFLDKSITSEFLEQDEVQWRSGDSGLGPILSPMWMGIFCVPGIIVQGPGPATLPRLAHPSKKPT